MSRIRRKRERAPARKCSKCARRNDRPEQRYCSKCHAAYQMRYRAKLKRERIQLARFVERVLHVKRSA